MAKLRLSKLQKNILTTLFEKGTDCVLVESIKKSNTKRIKEFEEKGYKFMNEYLDPKTRKPRGELRYEVTHTTGKLRRAKLLFIINDWQGYNQFLIEYFKLRL